MPLLCLYLAFGCCLVALPHWIGGFAPAWSDTIWVAYGVGRGGRIELLEHHGAKLHMGPAQIARADRWFQRYGDPARSGLDFVLTDPDQLYRIELK